MSQKNPCRHFPKLKSQDNNKIPQKKARLSDPFSADFGRARRLARAFAFGARAAWRLAGRFMARLGGMF